MGKGQDVSQYKYQIIVVLGNDHEVIKAGNYLSKQDPQKYQIIWLNDTTNLLQVKWNNTLNKYVPTAARLPSGQEWLQTHIQIVGHGDTKLVTVGGYTGENLAKKIMKLTKNNHVGCISIVACSTMGYLIDFTKAFMAPLITLVRISLLQVCVDPSGKIFRCQGWLVYESLTNKPIGVEFPAWIPQTISSLQMPNTGMEPIIYYHGFLGDTVPVYITRYNNIIYEIDNNVALKLIKEIAAYIYERIPQISNPTEHYQVKNNMFPMPEIQITVILGIDHLLKELRYYGDRGSRRWHPLVYYRFGPWILSMKSDNFYVTIIGKIEAEGIIPHKPIDERYTRMRPHLDYETFINDVIYWINGEHDKIGNNPYNAQFIMAMFLSESIRCFQNHITNMMAIQLIKSGHLTLDYFFNNHPMARHNTWQIRETGLGLLSLTPEQYKTSLKQKCMEKYIAAMKRKQKNKIMNSEDKIKVNSDYTNALRAYVNINLRISQIFRTWLSLISFQTFSGNRGSSPQLQPTSKNYAYLLNHIRSDIIKIIMHPQILEHLKSSHAGPLSNKAEEVNSKTKSIKDIRSYALMPSVIILCDDQLCINDNAQCMPLQVLNKLTAAKGPCVSVTETFEYTEANMVYGYKTEYAPHNALTESNIILLYSLHEDNVGGAGADTLVGGGSDDKVDSEEEAAAARLCWSNVDSSLGTKYSNTVKQNLLTLSGIQQKLTSVIYVHDKSVDRALTIIDTAYGIISGNVLVDDDSINAEIAQEISSTGCVYNNMMLTDDVGIIALYLTGTNDTVVIKNYTVDVVVDQFVSRRPYNAKLKCPIFTDGSHKCFATKHQCVRKSLHPSLHKCYS